MGRVEVTVHQGPITMLEFKVAMTHPNQTRGPVVLLGRTGLRRGSRPNSRAAVIDGCGAVDDATDAVVVAAGAPCGTPWTGRAGAGCTAETSTTKPVPGGWVVGSEG